MGKFKFFAIEDGGLKPLGEGEGFDENHALEAARLNGSSHNIAVPKDGNAEQRLWQLAPVADFAYE